MRTELERSEGYVATKPPSYVGLRVVAAASPGFP
jgi:hypothetical protein